jgi:hypothetical protein
MTDLVHMQRPKSHLLPGHLEKPVGGRWSVEHHGHRAEHHEGEPCQSRSRCPSRAERPSGAAALTVGRPRRVVAAADFYDLDGEGLEPGEQPMQSCLILERAVYHSLDRLDRGGEPVEVK